MLTIGEAKRIVGSLSFPSKMPSTSYDLPAQACNAGAALAKIVGTACAKCYVLVGRTSYRQPNAQRGMFRRLEAIAHPQWSDAMVRVLSHVHSKPFFRIDLGLVGVRLQAQGGTRWRLNKSGAHRWHGSGDLQSVDHFARICEVARRTPKIKHWLPTQELRFVARFLRDGGSIPTNLLVRASSVFIDTVTPRSWPTISTVFTKEPPVGAHVCPAPTQGNECRECRACWSPAVPHVAYHIH